MELNLELEIEEPIEKKRRNHPEKKEDYIKAKKEKGYVPKSQKKFPPKKTEEKQNGDSNVDSSSSSNKHRVQATNDDSIVSKRSSSRAGYFKDEFLRFFVDKPAKRSSLINRGYYIRSNAIRSFVGDFLKQARKAVQDGKAKTVQVVCFGCGFDTNFFHFSSEGLITPDICSYFELDFEGVVSRKSSAIQSNEELLQYIKNPKPVGIELHSDHYQLMRVDLRETAELEDKLINTGKLDFTQPTLFLAECVLTYINSKDTSNLIGWAASRFSTCQFVTYEQIIPGDAFGHVMCHSLKSRGSPLLGVFDYPDAEAQRNRYKILGYEKVLVQVVNDFWENLPADEINRIQLMEPFDEDEEWKIKCGHYFIVDGMKDKLGIFKEFSTPNYPIYKPIESTDYNQSKLWTGSLRGKKSLSLRYAQSACLVDQKIIIFGGFGQTHGQTHSRLNDIVVLDPKTLECSEPLPEGLAPSKRMFHTCTTIGESRVFVFGGREGPEKALNDFFLLDTKMFRWIPIQTNGDIPPPRWRHSATKVGNFLVIFGGRNEKSDMNDTYLLDLNLFQWKKVQSVDTPQPRSSHSATAINEHEMIVFGGKRNSIDVFNDLLLFNTQTCQWKKIEQNDGVPSPRFSHTSVFDEISKKILIIGGCTADRETSKAPNEIFSLDSKTFVWSKIKVDFPHTHMLVKHSSVLVDNNIIFNIGGGCLCFSFGSLFTPTSILSLDGKDLKIENAPEIESRDSKVSNGKSEIQIEKAKNRNVGIQEIPRIECPTLDQFLNEIYPKRKPIIFKNVDMGQCTQLWTPEYLKQKCGSKEVSVHSCKHKLMDFLNKNYTFESMTMNNLIDKMYETEDKNHNRYYLRSMGLNTRKDVSDIWESFPEISADFQVPNCVPMAHPKHEKYFSSAFRMSSRDAQMWTHFDVMDNILCEIKGRKKLVLWAPEDVGNLYMSGSSSHVLDIDNPDLSKYPRFTKGVRYECYLEPGEVIFIPAYWFHNVLALEPCIAVNIFWKHLNDEFYQKKDLYGNKDPVIAAKALEECEQLTETLSQIPEYYREFYVRKVISSIKSKFGL